MKRTSTFREVLRRARRIDTRHRVVEAGVRGAAVAGLALASVTWVGPGLALVGAALGWIGVGLDTVRRRVGLSAVLGRLPDEDGLLVTAWAVEQGAARGDAGLAQRVLERGLVRLESSEASLVRPLSWPWLATGLALLSLWLVPLPRGLVPAGTSSSVPTDPSVDVRSDPLARTALGAVLANLGGAVAGARRGSGAASGTASSVRPSSTGAAAATTSGAAGTASDGEGTGEVGIATGRTAASDSPLAAPALPDPERWLGPGDGEGSDQGGGSSDEDRAAGGEEDADPTDPSPVDEAAQARAGGRTEDRDSTMPLSAHAGTSDGRLAEQSEDLEDTRIDEGRIGPSREEVSREASSGKPGAMGSNDAPGLDDERSDVALAEAEVARQWVEAKLRSSPEGVIREVAQGRTGQRSEVGYRDLVQQYSAIAEASLHDDAIPIGRRDLVRAYFDALQEDSDESSDHR